MVIIIKLMIVKKLLKFIVNLVFVVIMKKIIRVVVNVIKFG